MTRGRARQAFAGVRSANIGPRLDVWNASLVPSYAESNGWLDRRVWFVKEGVIQQGVVLYLPILSDGGRVDRFDVIQQVKSTGDVDTQGIIYWTVRRPDGKTVGSSFAYGQRPPGWVSPEARDWLGINTSEASQAWEFRYTMYEAGRTSDQARYFGPVNVQIAWGDPPPASTGEPEATGPDAQLVRRFPGPITRDYLARLRARYPVFGQAVRRWDGRHARRLEERR